MVLSFYSCALPLAAFISMMAIFAAYGVHLIRAGRAKDVRLDNAVPGDNPPSAAIPEAEVGPRRVGKTQRALAWLRRLDARALPSPADHRESEVRFQARRSRGLAVAWIEYVLVLIAYAIAVAADRPDLPTARVGVALAVVGGLLWFITRRMHSSGRRR